MTTPQNITDCKLMSDATERICGSRLYGSTDRFVRMAIDSLLRSSGGIRINEQTWTDDEIITAYTVYVRELGPDGKERACFGETLAEALATAILTEEVIEL